MSTRGGVDKAQKALEVIKTLWSGTTTKADLQTINKIDTNNINMSLVLLKGISIFLFINCNNLKL